jgi:hypothetical protein
MKVSVNGTELFSLNETQRKVLCNDVSSVSLEDDCKRRLQWVLMHKHAQCMERLRKEWLPKLKGRVDVVPLDDDAFAQLVFKQEDYMDKAARDEAAKPVDPVVP